MTLEWAEKTFMDIAKKKKKTKLQLQDIDRRE
jgi:hypothetical protein